MSNLITLTEAANELGCSSRTVRRYIADGRVEAVRVGHRMIRVNRRSLQAILAPMGMVA